VCVALSSIRAKDGYTPIEVVETLLEFVELVSSSDEMKSTDGSHRIDDTYFRSILMLCFSRIRLSKEIKNADWWLEKILDVADIYLESARLIPPENKHINTQTVSQNGEHVGGGMLCSAALACLSEIDNQVGGLWSRNYISYIDEFYPPSVRITALECYVRLSLSKCITQSNEEGVGEHLANIINVTILVLGRDRCIDVRKNAALNLLHCIQDKPPRSVALSLSLSEVLLSVGWDDENALTLPTRRRYQREYLTSLRGCSSSKYCEALKKLWDFVTFDPSCDQSVRVLLMNIWSYVFDHSVPKALQKHGNVVTCKVTRSEKNEHFYIKESMVSEQPIKVVDPISNLRNLDQLMRYQDFLS